MALPVMDPYFLAVPPDVFLRLDEITTRMARRLLVDIDEMWRRNRYMLLELAFSQANGYDWKTITADDVSWAERSPGDVVAPDGTVFEIKHQDGAYWEFKPWHLWNLYRERERVDHVVTGSIRFKGFKTGSGWPVYRCEFNRIIPVSTIFGEGDPTTIVVHDRTIEIPPLSPRCKQTIYDDPPTYKRSRGVHYYDHRGE